MIRLIAMAVLTCGLGLAPMSYAREAGSTNADLAALARLAVADDLDRASEAIASLRAAGAAGLEAMFGVHADAIDAHAADPTRNDPQWQRLSCALDAVAKQKDAWASRLYWHTDLNAAMSEAKTSGKPILSLRLLGTLDTEFSCANSRFFRTALYANRDVSHVLRERFVLHWKSVRPVPKITIDFGDGRIIERTITGNSIHYVLSADGSVIDGIPGLYGPAKFIALLNTAEEVERAMRRQGSNAVSLLREWHMLRAQQVAGEWQADLRRVGAMGTEATTTTDLERVLATLSKVDAKPTAPTAAKAAPLAIGKFAAEAPLVRAVDKSVPGDIPPAGVIVLEPVTPNGMPTALKAAPLAIGKGAMELPVVRALQPADVAAMTRASDEQVWAKVAALHANEARLDAGSRALVRTKVPSAADAGERARGKKVVEDPLVRIVANFERSIAEDTVRNEYTFHRQIHEWLAAKATPVDELNERVYAELFLTPSSDPWLGLVPADTYTALEGDGRR